MTSDLKSDSNPIVVIGGSGFIGGSVIRHFAAGGRPVISTSSSDCDLLDAQSTESFFAALTPGSNIILASAITRTSGDSSETMLSNLQMIDNFILGVNRTAPRTVTFLSSVDVYGRNPDLPIREDTDTAPENYYGNSKLKGELLLSRPGALPCPLTILRLGGIYGAHDQGRSVVGKLTRLISAGNEVTVSGGGTTLRDYVDVRDIGKLIEALLPWSGSRLLNIATGKSVSVFDIISKISDAAGIEPSVISTPADESAAGDLVFNTANLAAAAPGFQLTPIETGISDYVLAIE